MSMQMETVDSHSLLVTSASVLQQQVQEADVLLECSRALTSTLTHHQLLAPLTVAAQRLCHVQGLFMGIMEQQQGEIELWTHTDAALHDQRFLLEPLLMKEVLQVGWPVFIADLARPPVAALLFDRLAREGYMSLLVIPLRAVHKVVGVLLTGWRSRHAGPTRHEEELLQLLADQAVQALSNIHLYQEQERHLNESESLRRIGQLISATLDLQDILKLVTNEVARLLSCEASMLTWRTADNEVEIAGASDRIVAWRGTRLPLRNSVTDLVVRERRAVRFEELNDFVFKDRLVAAGEAAPQGFLAVPLWQGEQPIGALGVFSTTPRSFSLEDERILQSLADQAVHAINNAQLYEQLRDALKREQDANRQKSAFFASASHELRTPLNIVLGYIDLIRDGVVGQIDQEGAELLGRARKAAHHMTALVNDLLDLACLERTEFQLRLEQVDLEDLLREICIPWERSLTTKGLTFQRLGPRVFPPFVTDKARFRQILDNLIGNAAKFTETGHILVGARVLDHSIEIWVEDTGVGIDPVYHEKIFDEFQQVAHASTPAVRGFGLGLAVCKKIARLLHGDIRLDSTVGRGSTFTFSLARQER
ncbi:MAG: GAF domain-containing protein [Candidatus Binatia bacterium]